MREDVLRAYPAVDPDRVRVIYNGIDADEYSARSGHRRARAPRHRPRSAHASSSSGASRARRASSTAAGRRRAFDPDAQLVLLRRRAGHRRARRGGRAQVDVSRPSAAAWSGSSRCCPGPRSCRSSATRRSSSARRSTSRSGIVNLEAMACEAAVVATARAASPRSSSTARPDCSCRSILVTTARLRRATRRRSRAPSPCASTRWSPTRRSRRDGQGGTRSGSSSTSAGRRSRSRPSEVYRSLVSR